MVAANSLVYGPEEIRLLCEKDIDDISKRRFLLLAFALINMYHPDGYQNNR